MNTKIKALFSVMFFSAVVIAGGKEKNGTLCPSNKALRTFEAQRENRKANKVIVSLKQEKTPVVKRQEKTPAFSVRNRKN